jgi:hypothetical protein
MLLSTPIDYKLPEDPKAEKVLRAIQDRERNFLITYTRDLYVKFSDIPEEKIRSTNILKHEWIDNSIKRLKRRDFIEKISVNADRRRVELRTKPEEIYTSMIRLNPTIFWRLIEKGYFYFIIRFNELDGYVSCPKCQKKSKLALNVSGNKASRYIISDELHIDIILRHLTIEFRCDCGYSYSNEVDMYDPMTLEQFNSLYKASENRRNLL